MIGDEKLCEMLGTLVKKDPSDKNYFGLTDEQAHQKFIEFGPNALSEKKEMPAIVRYMLLMTGLFNYMLWIGSILCFIAYGLQTTYVDKSNLYLGVVLIGVILITATMSYF